MHPAIHLSVIGLDLIQLYILPSTVRARNSDCMKLLKKEYHLVLCHRGMSSHENALTIYATKNAIQLYYVHIIDPISAEVTKVETTMPSKT
jgi:hypothetical protein